MVVIEDVIDNPVAVVIVVLVSLASEESAESALPIGEVGVVGVNRPLISIAFSKVVFIGVVDAVVAIMVEIGFGPRCMPIMVEVIIRG